MAPRILKKCLSVHPAKWEAKQRHSVTYICRACACAFAFIDDEADIQSMAWTHALNYGKKWEGAYKNGHNNKFTQDLGVKWNTRTK